MLDVKFYKPLESFALDISFTLGSNEILAILGTSGAGKSTLLNCIAGYTSVEQGYFEIDKMIYEDKTKNIAVPINKRHIAYMQQNSRLFPHINVKENIMYSVPKPKRKEIQKKYEHIITLLGIQNLENRKPMTLSGGEKQRVAIGRCFMMEPKLILWDEPFSALDHRIREELRKVVIALKEELHIPMIFVTHDINEAYQVADQLAIMEKGKILQMDKKENVFRRPLTAKVGEIIGVENILTRKYEKNENILSKEERNTVTIGMRASQIHYVKAAEKDENTKDIESIESIENIENIENIEKVHIEEAMVISVIEDIEKYRVGIKIAEVEEILLMDIPYRKTLDSKICVGNKIKVKIYLKNIMIMREKSDEIINEKKVIENLHIIWKQREGSISGQQKIMEQKDTVQNSREKRRGDKEQSIETERREEYALNKYRGMKKERYSCPVIGIAGVSNSGKTTVITKILPLLTEQGYDIGVVKHDGHDFEIDQEEKDTYRFRNAGAKDVTIASRNKYCIIRKTQTKEISLNELLKKQNNVDLVIVEGYKFSNLPKFEVVRKARSQKGVCRTDTVLGYITDLQNLGGNIPLFEVEEIDAIGKILKEIIKKDKYER